MSNMRISLASTFADSIRNLPQNVQKNFWDFTEKFSRNPNSKGIHLELLRKNIYSAKLNGGYRVILWKPQEGEFVLLQAGKHDDPYEWIENRNYEWNEWTHEIQSFVCQEPASLSEKEHGSFLFDGIDKKHLLRLGVPESLIPMVWKIRETTFDQYEDIFPKDVYQRLKDICDGNNPDEIIKEIESWKAKEEDPFLSANSGQIIQYDDKVFAGIIRGEFEKWQLFLHPMQKKLVEDNYRGSVKVSGSAGTGKTIAAIHRLKHLAEQPNANVLFTTYTKALKNNLVGMIAKMGVPSQHYKIDNIDKILNSTRNEMTDIPSYEILEYKNYDRSKDLWGEVLQHHKGSEFNEDFLHGEYLEVILYYNTHNLESYLKQPRIGGKRALSRKQRIEIWKLKEEYEALKRRNKCFNKSELFNLVTNYLVEKGIHPYTNVIVDEFQDLSNPQLRFLRALVAEGPNDMFIVGDPFQRVYDGRGINFSAAGINIRGKRSKKLKINYRTTEEIKKTAVSVIKDCRYDDMDGGEEDNKGYISFSHGERPTYKVFESIDEETDQVMTYIDFCRKRGIQLKDICVTAKTKSYGKDIQKALRRRKITFCEIVDGEKTGDKDGLSFCTIYSIKGLEYAAVIVAGVNEYRFPTKKLNEEMDPLFSDNSTSTDQKNRSLLYVAITRARQIAFITGVGAPTKLLELTK